MTIRWGLVAAAASVLAVTAAPAHVKPGDVVPPYSLTTFDKAKTSSADLHGQVVIINLWATWCGPCKHELPLLDAYYRAHAKDGLKVFAVSTEGSVPDYMLDPLQKALAIPLAHRVSGTAFAVLDGVPTNYVIDRQGVVRYAKAAAFDEQALDEIVGPLLAEPPPAAVKTAAN